MRHLHTRLETSRAFEPRAGDDYAVQIPPAMVLTPRGVHVMLEDFGRSRKTKPTAVLMSQDLLTYLCYEAAMVGEQFLDKTDALTPCFEGVRILLLEPEDDEAAGAPKGH